MRWIVEEIIQRLNTGEGIAEQLRQIREQLALIKERHMVDTSKILAAVDAAKTKIDSLIALSNGQSQKMKDLSTQLAAAIAANDPVALAQVQADLDKASTELSTENDAVDAAIAANTTQV